MGTKMIRKLENGLIVSCQALKTEPLYGGDTIVKMAKAAVLGGAVGIRANTVKDIKKINSAVNVPIIGLIKKVYSDSDVYITPTLTEVNALIKSPCDVIALDCTAQSRPNNVSVNELIFHIRKNSNKLIMADVSTIEETIFADELGVDYISSTLRGYTPYTSSIKIPDIDFLGEMMSVVKNAQVVAEGGIRSEEMLGKILQLGYSTVIIGGAITRPMEITQHYVEVFSNEKLSFDQKIS